ncbi:PEP-utilizing enzyme (plasmid) [Deinococcus radiodurans]|nr:PEP-utilizing enzyme [Deinococcus radiodurans]
MFSIAGGLVIESFAGGMLSHAALVAREYRIPAILGIKSACSLLDGRYVDLDGTTGLVEIGRRFESM